MDLEYLNFKNQLFHLIERFGSSGSFWGITLYIILLLYLIYNYVGGNKKMLLNNTDIKGKKHSWKSTILGITFFIISIPIVIYLSLHIFGFL